METDENLIRFMDAVASGEAVPAGLADRLIADYPWFVLPAAMRLQRGSDRLDADARQMLAARVALGMADRTAMLRLADVIMKTASRHLDSPLRGCLRPPTLSTASASLKSISKGAATKRLMKLSIH